MESTKDNRAKAESRDDESSTHEKDERARTSEIFQQQAQSMGITDMTIFSKASSLLPTVQHCASLLQLPFEDSIRRDEVTSAVALFLASRISASQQFTESRDSNTTLFSAPFSTGFFQSHNFITMTTIVRKTETRFVDMLELLGCCITTLHLDTDTQLWPMSEQQQEQQLSYFSLSRSIRTTTKKLVLFSSLFRKYLRVFTLFHPNKANTEKLFKFMWIMFLTVKCEWHDFAGNKHTSDVCTATTTADFEVAHKMFAVTMAVLLHASTPTTGSGESSTTSSDLDNWTITSAEKSEDNGTDTNHRAWLALQQTIHKLLPRSAEVFAALGLPNLFEEMNVDVVVRPIVVLQKIIEKRLAPSDSISTNLMDVDPSQQTQQQQSQSSDGDSQQTVTPTQALSIEQMLLNDIENIQYETAHNTETHTTTSNHDQSVQTASQSNPPAPACTLKLVTEQFHEVTTALRRIYKERINTDSEGQSILLQLQENYSRRTAEIAANAALLSLSLMQQPSLQQSLPHFEFDFDEQLFATHEHLIGEPARLISAPLYHPIPPKTYSTPQRDAQIYQTLRSTSPVSQSLNAFSMLKSKLSAESCEPDEALQSFFRSCTTDPTTEIVSTVSKFTEALQLNGLSKEQLISRRLLIRKLSFHVLRNILTAERDRLGHSNFTALLQSQSFIQSLTLLSAEAVLFASNCSDQLSFTQLIEMFNMQPFEVCKVIETFVSHVTGGLPSSVLRHFRFIEESILEQLAWVKNRNASLFERLKSYNPHAAYIQQQGLASGDDQPTINPILAALQGPSLGQVLHGTAATAASVSPTNTPAASNNNALLMTPAKHKGSASLQVFSPAKPHLRTSVPRATGDAARPALEFFFRKIFRLVAARITSLCAQFNVHKDVREQVWRVMYYVLTAGVEEREALLEGRHLDQLVLSSMYAVCNKVYKMKISFRDIVNAYKQLVCSTMRQISSVEINKILWQVPLSTNVSSGSSATCDIVKFYNAVFIPRLKAFILQLPPISLTSGNTSANSMLLSPPRPMWQQNQHLQSPNPNVSSSTPAPSPADNPHLLSPHRVSASANVFVSPMRSRFTISSSGITSSNTSMNNGSSTMASSKSTGGGFLLMSPPRASSSSTSNHQLTNSASKAKLNLTPRTKTLYAFGEGFAGESSMMTTPNDTYAAANLASLATAASAMIDSTAATTPKTVPSTTSSSSPSAASGSATSMRSKRALFQTLTEADDNSSASSAATPPKLSLVSASAVTATGATTSANFSARNVDAAGSADDDASLPIFKKLRKLEGEENRSSQNSDATMEDNKANASTTNDEESTSSAVAHQKERS